VIDFVYGNINSGVRVWL